MSTSGLELTLGDSSSDAQPQAATPQPGTELPAEDSAVLLRRLPDLKPSGASAANPAGASAEARLPPASLPPPRAGRTRLAVFPAEAGAPPVALPPPGPLRVIRHSPEGDVAVAPGVTLEFSHAMVPLASIGQLSDAPIPATLTPQPPGRWRWLDTRTLRFEPQDGQRLPAATRYEVEVPAGTRSATGAATGAATAAVLATSVRFTFSTPAPRALRFMPQGAATALRPTMALVFDSRVDPAAILAHLRVTAAGKTFSVEPVAVATLAASGDASVGEDPVARWLGDARRERCVVFRTTRDLPMDSEISVTLPRGAPSLEGPLTTQHEQSFKYQTHGSLRLLESTCGWGGPCRPSQPWTLVFSNPLDEAPLDESVVRVVPALDGQIVRVAGNRLMIEGATRARTRYEAQVSPRLKDVFGQHPVGESRASFSVEGAEPSLQLPGEPFIVLPAAGSPSLSVFSSGHAALRLRAWRVEPRDWNNVALAVRRSQEQEGRVLELPGHDVRESVVRVAGSVDELVETKLPLSEALGGERGQLLVSIETDGKPSARLVAWVQVTGIGLDALVDPSRLVAWATDLATGAPLRGARLSVEPSWTAQEGDSTKDSDADGLARFDLPAADGPPRMLVARLGDDVAFLPELPWWGWEGQRSAWTRRSVGAHLAAHVLDDRGIYRPGETAHVRGWLRDVDHAIGGGVSLTKAAPLTWILFDSVRNEIARGTTPLSATSAFALSITLPEGMNLGYSSLEFSLEGQSSFTHPLRVEEFRRPEYEVSVEADAGPHFVGASTTLRATASYYAGGGLPNAPVTWNLVARPAQFHPPGWDDFVFGRFRPWWRSWIEPGAEKRWSHAGQLDHDGVHALALSFDSVTPAEATSLEAEATVMDVNRQAWSARTTLLVHACPLQVGARLPKLFIERGEHLPVQLIVTDVDGKAQAGRVVDVRATRQAWRLVKGEWKDVEEDAVECRAVSGDEPVACDLRLDRAGAWTVKARVMDEKGRANETSLLAWVSGAETIPDRQLREAEAEVIPDKKEHAVGETARLLVRSPFAPAEGLLTLRRGGLVSERRFRMEQPSVVLDVPIEAGWEPGLTASVLLSAATGANTPAFARGSVQLKIPPRTHELRVDARPRVTTLEPGERTTIDLSVVDSHGKPVSGEVTLIVADEAVLALTGYDLRDPLATFFPERAEEVIELRLRQHVILPGAASITAGNESLGGGRSATDGYRLKSAMPMMAMAAEAAPAPGGADASPVALRSDLSALALFEPAIALDAAGHASVDVKLPDSLTRWRVMAIASSGVTGFGRAESTITARKALMLRPSPPRFLNVGDRVELPVVVQNAQDIAVIARVGLRLANATLDGPAAREILIPARDRVELRFPVRAALPGTTRLQVIASDGVHSDAIELSWPTWTPATTAAFATQGVLDEDGAAVAQPLLLPEDALPNYGGLELTTSSTALAELGDAVLYLHEYPFACSEQLASRILGITALRDMVKAFSGLPNEAAVDAALAQDVKALVDRQRPDGSFGLWRRDNEPREWPYVSLHATHALLRARAKGLPVDEQAIERALAFAQRVDMRGPADCGLAARATMAAYALHVRRVAGDPVPSRARQIVKESGEALPLEALAWLIPVIAEDPKAREEAAQLTQRLLNAAVETASAASFATSTAELGDDAYLVMHSSRRIDAIALESLLDLASNASKKVPGTFSAAEKVPGTFAPKLVRGLLDHRVAGRWSNTQENAFVLLALDRYFRAHEATAPDFVASAWLGAQPLQREAFRGRSTDRRQTLVPLAELGAIAGPTADVILAKEGPGRLYWRLALRYAPKSLSLPPAEQGFRVERSYEAVTDPSDVRRDADGTWHVRAGALVRVRVRVAAPARRTHVAVVDPLPAGLEVVNAALETSQQVVDEPRAVRTMEGRQAWPGGWAEHENLRDDRAESFTSLLWEGAHEQVHLCRATSLGRFVAPPAKAEEMYQPETFGRSATDIVIVESSP